VAVGKVWVGIDVDKGFHHACVVDETGGVVFSRKVANGQAAIEQLIARTNAKAGEVVWAVDMTSRREDLMADRVRGINRLRELLASIFPALERAFDYSTRSALVLLTGFQTPAGIREAGAAGLSVYLTEHGAWAKGIPSMVDKALVVAGEKTVALQAESVTAALIARLACQLLDLDREIEDLNGRLGDRFAEHPHAEHITSVDGFGSVPGAQLLADTGGDLPTAFGNPGRLAACAGLELVPGGAKRLLSAPLARGLIAGIKPRDIVGRTWRGGSPASSRRLPSR
jgi:transposase